MRNPLANGCVLAVSAVILSSCIAGASAVPDSPAPDDAFPGNIVRSLSARADVTPREIQALQDCRRILLLAADDEYLARWYFWLHVRGEETQRISWQEARELILAGRIVTASQSHSHLVSLTTFDGRRYAAMEPEIDDVNRAINEVDPKKVFIGYETE